MHVFLINYRDALLKLKMKTVQCRTIFATPLKITSAAILFIYTINSLPSTHLSELNCQCIRSRLFQETSMTAGDANECTLLNG